MQVIFLIKLPQLVGLAAGILTASSLLPQLSKMIKEKEVDDISFPMLMMLIIGIALWVYYGILREDWPIIITNSFSFFVNGIMIVLRFKYKHSSKK